MPSSLGYGVLDKSSVKIENEVISADYLLECDRSVVNQPAGKHLDTTSALKRKRAAKNHPLPRRADDAVQAACDYEEPAVQQFP